MQVSRGRGLLGFWPLALAMAVYMLTVWPWAIAVPWLMPRPLFTALVRSPLWGAARLTISALAVVGSTLIPIALIVLVSRASRLRLRSDAWAAPATGFVLVQVFLLAEGLMMSPPAPLEFLMAPGDLARGLNLALSCVGVSCGSAIAWTMLRGRKTGVAARVEEPVSVA